ncbi:MAG TPA: hypothetical protein VE377_03830 [Candidatus Dormibacteraeota bacterium]|nr:hypothetical protein [Candidatus Dormibacteraeota bacterium]
MKKFALIALLALEFAVCGCGNSTTPTTTSTQATGNWEAQMTGGTEQASLLNFVTAFNVTNSGPLSVTGFGFFNSGSCFATGTNAATVSGNATFTTSSTNSVTGTLTMTVTSTTNGSVLTLGTPNPATLTGTSNGTTTTTGTLSNGVVVGNWSLQPGSGANGCNAGGGTFVMCQDKATCSTTGAAAAAERILK